MQDSAVICKPDWNGKDNEFIYNAKYESEPPLCSLVPQVAVTINQTKTSTTKRSLIPTIDVIMKATKIIKHDRGSKCQGTVNSYNTNQR